jgi:endonuclease YncB( thermonuclease family)
MNYEFCIIKPLTNVKNEDRFLEAYKQARKDKRGLWGKKE